MTIIAPLHQFGGLSFTRKDQWVIFNGFKGCRQDAKGEGKYLEGGKEAGGQLVDQRFCPRIVEGEVYLGVVSGVGRCWEKHSPLKKLKKGPFQKENPFFFQTSIFHNFPNNFQKHHVSGVYVGRRSFASSWDSVTFQRGELRYNLIGDSLSPGRKRFRKHIP